MITHISGVNIKGCTFEMECGPLVQIVGPNMSGKTSRLVAIRLALMGAEPTLGKSNPAVFAASSGATMEAAVRLSDGRSFRRVWKRNGKGAVSCEGPEDTVQVPCLDPDAYFARKAQERMNYVFEQADLGEKWTTKKVVALLREWASVTASPVAERLVKALEDAAQGTKRGQEALPLMLDACRGLYREFGAERDRSGETVRKLTELKHRDAETTSHRPETVRAELETKRGEVETLTKKYATAKATLDAWDAERNKAESWQARHDRLEADIRMSGEEIAKLKAPEVPTTDDEEKAYDIALSVATMVTTAVQGAEKALAIAETEQKAADRLVSQYEEVKGECPFCGAEPKHGLTKRKAKAVADQKKAAAAVARAREALEHNRKSAEEKAAALTSAKNALKKARETREARLSGLRVFEKTTAEWKTRIEGSKKALADLGPRPEKVGPPPAPAGDLAEALERAKADVMRLQNLLESVAATARDAQLASKAKADQDAAESGLDLCKKAAEWLKEKQRELLTSAVGPILEVANRVFEPVSGKRLEFSDDEVGYWREHRFVTHATFSGAEKQLAYVGFAVGLSPKGGLRVAMLDEFGRLDKKARSAALLALEKAVDEKVVEQAFVVLPEMVHTPRTWQIEEVR